jgi:hypothetical protein
MPQRYGFNVYAPWLGIADPAGADLPDAGKFLIYPGVDGLWRTVNNAGVVTFLTGGAVSNASISLTGTGGAGYLQALAQSSNPSAPAAAGVRLFAEASGYLAWREKVGADTFTRTFNGVLTADRTYTLPDFNGTFATLAGVETLTNKTLTNPVMTTPTLGVAAGTSLALTGHLGYGGTAVSATDGLISNENFGNLTTTTRGATIQPTATLTGNNANVLGGAIFSASIDQNSFNATATLGARGFTASGNASGASGIVTGAVGVLSSVNNLGAGTLTNGYAIQVPTPANSGVYTNYAGLAINAPASPTNKTYILAGTLTIPTGDWFIYSTSASNSSILGKLGVGRNATPLATFDAQVSDAGTTTVIEVAAFVRNSSGTPAAALGGDNGYYLKSSTTADTLAARQRWFWSTSTHASRKANVILSAYDTVERDIIGFGASGSAGLLGFFPTVAAAPVVQQVDGAALTNNVTSGGTTDTIANYTDLSVYANDAAAIRNDLYLLSRKLKIVDDALRAYGLLT